MGLDPGPINLAIAKIVGPSASNMLDFVQIQEED